MRAMAMTDDNQILRRAIVLVAAIFGACGVMAAAASSHGQDVRNLSAIATIGLAHGPALLAIGLAGRGRFMLIAGAVLALGTALFIADLGMREWLGHGLFAGAAPLGGGGMIVGWVLIGLSALLPRQDASKSKT